MTAFNQNQIVINVYFDSVSLIVECNKKINTSNHMLGREIWNKLPECIFEKFEIARVKRGQFQNFQKSRGLFIPKIILTKHVITG